MDVLFPDKRQLIVCLPPVDRAVSHVQCMNITRCARTAPFTTHQDTMASVSTSGNYFKLLGNYSTSTASLRQGSHRKLQTSPGVGAKERSDRDDICALPRPWMWAPASHRGSGAHKDDHTAARHPKNCGTQRPATRAGAPPRVTSWGCTVSRAILGETEDFRRSINKRSVQHRGREAGEAATEARLSSSTVTPPGGLGGITRARDSLG